MVTWLVILGLTWLTVAALLIAGTYVLQGYVNDAPPDTFALLWRGAVAALIVVGLESWLCSLSCHHPDVYAPPLDFSVTNEEKPVAELLTITGRDRYVYRLRKDIQGRSIYLEEQQGRELRSRPDEIVIKRDPEDKKDLVTLEKEDREEVEQNPKRSLAESKVIRFLPPRDSEGKFRTAAGQGLRYLAPDGRYMEEGYYGRITSFRSGRWFLYILLNLGHLLVWWGCLWLLLQYPWSQALLMAFIFYLVATLLILPPVVVKLQATAGTAILLPS